MTHSCEFWKFLAITHCLLPGTVLSHTKTETMTMGTFPEKVGRSAGKDLWDLKTGLLQKITSVDPLGGLKLVTRMSQKGYHTAKTKTRK